MSWGIQLWDQCENVSAHTQRGIQFLDRYGDFLRERSQVEVDYAKSLRLLCRKFQPKKKEDLDNEYSCGLSFMGVLDELTDVAGQHELIAENLKELVATAIQTAVKDIREQRKMYFDELRMLQHQMDNGIAALNQTKRDYVKSWKESEVATSKYHKSDQDMNLSRNDVEKAKAQMNIKCQLFEESKHSYALQLQKTNELQRIHYQDRLPAVFEKIRVMDENRIRQFRGVMLRSIAVEQNILPIVDKCLDGMIRQAEGISHDEDSQAVIDNYRSGYLPPQDIPFDDLSGNSISTSNTPHGACQINGFDFVDGSSIGDPNNRLSSNHEKIYALSTGVSSPKAHNNVAGSSASSSSGGGNDSVLVRSSRFLTHASGSQTSSIPRKSTMRRTKLGKIMSRFANKSDSDCRPDYSDLPPQQRLNRIRDRMDAVQSQLNQLTSARDGLLKMQRVYEQNPNYGDASGVHAEMLANATSIEKLQAELKKLENWERDAASSLNTPINQVSTIERTSGRCHSMSSSYYNHYSPAGTRSSHSQKHSPTTDEIYGEPFILNHGARSSSHRTATRQRRHSSVPRPRSSISSDSANSHPSASDYHHYHIGMSNTLNTAAYHNHNGVHSNENGYREDVNNNTNGTMHNNESNGRHYGKQLSVPSHMSGSLVNTLGYTVGDRGQPSLNTGRRSSRSGGGYGDMGTTRGRTPELITGDKLTDLVTARLQAAGVLSNGSDRTNGGTPTNERISPDGDHHSNSLSPFTASPDQSRPGTASTATPCPDAVGTCRMLYDFDGGNEGTLSVHEGDQLVVLERDEGDGWTRVARGIDLQGPGNDGFVPTSYLELKLH